jgi:HSP20 family protein
MSKQRGRELETVRGKVAEFFQESFHCSSIPAMSTQSTWTPNTDVFETEDHLVVKMELAGIRKDDIEITLDGRVLIVRGMRPDPCRHHRCTFRQMEVDYGHFERRLVIPKTIDGSRVRAQYHNGFLHIDLPKAQKTDFAAVTVIIEQGNEQ